MLVHKKMGPNQIEKTASNLGNYMLYVRLWCTVRWEGSGKQVLAISDGKVGLGLRTKHACISSDLNQGHSLLTLC